MHKKLLVVFDLFFSLELSYVYNYNKKLPKKKNSWWNQINQIISSHNPYPSKNERKPSNKQANASKQKKKYKIKFKKTHTPKPKQTNW